MSGPPCWSWTSSALSAAAPTPPMSCSTSSTPAACNGVRCCSPPTSRSRTGALRCMTTTWPRPSSTVSSSVAASWCWKRPPCAPATCKESTMNAARRNLAPAGSAGIGLLSPPSPGRAAPLPSRVPPHAGAPERPAPLGRPAASGNRQDLVPQNIMHPRSHSDPAIPNRPEYPENTGHNFRNPHGNIGDSVLHPEDAAFVPAGEG